MNRFILLCVGLCLAQTVFASSIIIFDQGINTQQTWRVPQNFRGPKGCQSIPLQFVRENPTAESFFLLVFL